MVVSIALSVTFPLLFVRGRARWLPLLALGALAAHVPVEWAGSSAWGLGGIAAGLALTTAGVLAVLLAALGALRSASLGVAVAALSCGIPALAGFGLASLLPTRDRRAPRSGSLVYCGVLAVWRPAGLVDGVGLPAPVRLTRWSPPSSSPGTAARTRSRASARSRPPIPAPHVIVVDNASTDGTAEAVRREFPGDSS